MTVPQEERKELDILFPSKTVGVGGGKTIEVHPISLEDLPKVLDAMTQLFRLSLGGAEAAEIAVEGAKEVLQLIPYSVDGWEHVNLKRIPSSVVPPLLDAIVELNFTEEAVSKFKALSERAKRLGIAQGPLSVPASPKPSSGS